MFGTTRDRKTASSTPGLDGWAPQAHDIRNIVSSISMIAEELSASDAARQKQLGLRLHRSCARMLDICASPTLDTPSYSPPSSEQLDHLVSDVLELAQFVAGDAVHLSASAPTVTLTPEEAQAIFRILSNLVTNAVMAQRSAGGAVRVHARQVENRIEIDVIDRGPGLLAKPDRKPQDAPTRRSGLGTTICELLADGIGGKVALIHTGPRGTRFRITLPRD